MFLTTRPRRCVAMGFHHGNLESRTTYDTQPGVDCDWYYFDAVALWYASGIHHLKTAHRHAVRGVTLYLSGIAKRHGDSRVLNASSMDPDLL